MRRIAGVIISVVGLVLLVLGIAKVVAGVAPTGGLAMLVGLIVFGLSFIRPHLAGPDAPPPLTAFERVAGVFYEPARVFQNLRYHPRWLAAFLVMTLCSVAYQIAFVQRLTPEVIVGTTIDKTAESGFIPADKVEEIKQQQIEAAKSPVGKITGPLGQIGATFIVMLAFAGIYLLCVIAFGGRMNFWQALSVAMHASLPPVVIQSLLSILLLYLKSPDDIDPIKGQRGLVRADLGILFSPADHPYLYTIAGFFGIITLYGLWLTATGLHNTAESLSKSSAWIIAILLWGLGLLLALGAAAVFPSFVT